MVRGIGQAYGSSRSAIEAETSEYQKPNVTGADPRTVGADPRTA